MPLKIYRLRRLLAATAVLLSLVVAGMYFFARWRATDVLKSIPGKIGLDIKQTANGFQISKSDGKRTLFTVQASKVKKGSGASGTPGLDTYYAYAYAQNSGISGPLAGMYGSYSSTTGGVSGTVSYANSANGFTTNVGTGYNAANDSAYFYGSPSTLSGSDTYYAYGDYAAYAKSTTVQSAGMFGSYSYGASGNMTSVSYANSALGFGTNFGYATSDSNPKTDASDTAYLYGLTGNNTLNTDAAIAELYGSNFNDEAADFGAVTADGSEVGQGKVNTQNNTGATDYVLSLVGTWGG